MSPDMEVKAQPRAETEGVIVKLDESALNEARAILHVAYQDEPAFRYLFDSKKQGYDQRIRATIRELTHAYVQMNQEAIGVMVGETLVGVAFLGEPELRLTLADNWSWRARMVLTAGLSSTRRYVEYHKRLTNLLPQPKAHQLPLIGIHPKYKSRGYGRLLLQSVARLCKDNPRGGGLVLDTGNASYLPFYQSEGFRSLGTIRLGDIEDHVLYRNISGE